MNEVTKLFAENAINNAARIALEIPNTQDASPMMVQWVSDAAWLLAEVESGEGFTWEEQPEDWESVCAIIAGEILDDRKPTLESIRAAIKGEGTCDKCGEQYDPCGDGYCGLYPSCADKSEGGAQ